MAGKGGGAWKVAYADFVTAMMAFFMVMWLVGQKPELKQEVAQYFQDPSVQLLPNWISAGQGGTQKKKRYDGDKDGKNGRPKTTHARLLIRSDADRPFAGCIIRFAEDSAELSDESRANLDELVPQIRGKENRLEIRGHTDRRPPTEGSRFTDPWQLCYARSVAVMRYLEEKGIEPRRMRLSQAGVYEPAGGGKPGDPAEDARVEIYVLSEFAEPRPGEADPSHPQAQLDAHARLEAHDAAADIVPVPPPPPGYKSSSHGGGHGGGGHGGGGHGGGGHGGGHGKKENSHGAAPKSGHGGSGGHGGGHGKPKAKGGHGGH